MFCFDNFLYCIENICSEHVTFIEITFHSCFASFGRPGYFRLIPNLLTYSVFICIQIVLNLFIYHSLPFFTYLILLVPIPFHWRIMVNYSKYILLSFIVYPRLLFCFLPLFSLKPSGSSKTTLAAAQLTSRKPDIWEKLDVQRCRVYKRIHKTHKTSKSRIKESWSSWSQKCVTVDQCSPSGSACQQQSRLHNTTCLSNSSLNEINAYFCELQAKN